MLYAINATAIIASAVTGATAVFVGLIGYFTSRISADVALRQSEAETQRLREQRHEEHLQHRQGLYLDLLNRERSFFHVPDDAVREGVVAWQLGVVEAANAVVLFGTVETAKAAIRLLNLVAAVLDEVPPDPLESYPERLDVVAAKFRQEWRNRRRELVEAMRGDCAPDRQGIRWGDDE